VSLEFLSPTRCEPGTLTSPLRRALDTVSDTGVPGDAGLRDEGVRHRLVRDLSLNGVVEIRGDPGLMAPGGDEELVRLSPRRGFLFTDDDPADVAERLRARGVLAYDATGALAGIAIGSEKVMRRLTDLDLERLPTAGPFAHVTAIVRRDDAGWFEVYVQQELGHYVAEAVVDALAGLDVSRGLTPTGEGDGA
jgi:hypothetical protein